MPRLTSEVQKAQEEAKRLKIRQALLGMLEEKPLEEITIAQIAAKVNISSVTLYKYYSSRAKLINDVFQYSRDIVFAKLHEIFGRPASPRERILTAVHTMFAESAGQYNLFIAFYKNIIINEEFLAHTKERSGSLISLFAESIKAGIADGSFRKVNPHDAALVIFESILGLHHHAIFGGYPLDIDKATQTIASILLDGLVDKS